MSNTQSDEFRKIFGHFPTGITVIGMNNNGQLSGITANSVTSVSLDPMLLLVCIAKSAASHNKLKSAGNFSINFLSNQQKDVSQFFASTASKENPMGDFEYRLGGNESPIFNDVIAWVECSIIDWFPGGDHSIVIGEVSEMKIENASYQPLVYYNGQYGELA